MVCDSRQERGAVEVEGSESGSREIDGGSRSRLRSVGLVISGLMAGMGLAYLLSAVDLPARSSPAPEAAPATDGYAAPPPAPTPGASDARAAVERFLAAETRHDFAGSYALLSSADRQQISHVDTWIASHPDLLPPIEAFQVEDAIVGDGRGEVVTLIDFEPGLNEVTGLTPGRARVTWVTVEAEDGWRLAVTETMIEPLYPPDEEALAAVSTWVTARQDCLTGIEAGEHAGGLLGLPPLADELCGQNGEKTTSGPTGPLPASDAAQFVAAFGPSFDEWSRVVDVDSTDMRVVVAPVGAEWVVIGVLPPSPGS